MATSRVASILGAVAVLASILSGCGLFPGTSAQPSSCNGVPADIGGCADAPTYEGTTCEALSAEWGQEVDDRILKVIAEPPVVNDKQRSARIHDVLVLATVTLGLRMGEIGLLGHCSATEILMGAQPAFTAALKIGIVSALYDDSPAASWEQFNTEAMRVLSVLDAPASSKTP